ncbi:hypothetical protein ABMA58_18180, partial [Oceanospirillum sp. HFRX-1_2]
ELIIISAVELALLQAEGADLKIVLTKTNQPDSSDDKPEEMLRVQVEQSEGQHICVRTPWAEQIRLRLKELTTPLGGRFDELDDGGEICCRLPL